MQNRLQLWLSILLLFVSVRPGATQPVWEPPTELSVRGNHKPTVRRELITSLRVGEFTVVLEETKLSDAHTHFGGSIGRRGDASDGLAWLCLNGRDDGGSWILWLEAGEIHGGTVGAFQLRRVNPSTLVDKRCSVIGSTRRLELVNGIRLGLSRAQMMKILGPPTTSAGDTLLYSHERQQAIRGQVATATDRLTIRFRDTVLDAVDMWKMTVF